MTMLERLSSAIGRRTQDANRAAAEQILREPKLLENIAAGLSGNNAALIGDCAEVMTKVAETFPLLIVPYMERLGPLLAHKSTRVRWEAAHAIALAAPYAPQRIFPLLRTLTRLIREDGSVAVRDYAVDALCRYGAADEESARTVVPPLRDALAAWDGKHRARILDGLVRIAPVAPELSAQLLAIGEQYVRDGKPAVRKAAEALLREAGKTAGI
ncbi:hypothetical protein SD70_30775 [Gordoniibacillus kamchatkensis]|uniref:HEAT repeat domain-containing protein n=2 Tax=Gordoniibacillus kamchatkensis TaxID=1590651 RepID=A0ABR5A9Q9_9BACL|nr:hypothetical protein SD70_30775 [Paenibacillus sp. VKM B-2647]